MPNVNYTDALKREYQRLFDSCDIRPDKRAQVEKQMQTILDKRTRYEQVAQRSGIPWCFVAVIHNMEASLSFTRHLHNGDPLSARTVQVPAGRPKDGTPPFTWEHSAGDALGLKGLGKDTDWSLPGLLYQVERYNGWGYRLYHPEVLTPYLWCFSNHYRSGKYVQDGTWSDTAVSNQCGAASLLRRLAERGHIQFRDQPPPGSGDQPMVRYMAKKSSDPLELARAQDLQRWLNSYPGIFVRVDGWASQSTSDAYKKVTGHYLAGDPRA